MQLKQLRSGQHRSGGDAQIGVVAPHAIEVAADGEDARPQTVLPQDRRSGFVQAGESVIEGDHHRTRRRRGTPRPQSLQLRQRQARETAVDQVLHLFGERGRCRGVSGLAFAACLGNRVVHQDRDAVWHRVWI